ncbi:MAG: hypothetical protein JXR51_14125, partial [Bacteroidales bacterium]|nr:hypothetical protein [Bacteroidales bacterium]MBN2758306.1 hypothetical protein [Bacteroidales bacterium]
KLQQRVFKQGNLEKVTDYIGNYVYQNGKLAFIQTDEGRLLPKDETFEYEHFIKDHLGNNRLIISDTAKNGKAVILDETHYYPFGMLTRSKIDLY